MCLKDRLRNKLMKVMTTLVSNQNAPHSLPLKKGQILDMAWIGPSLVYWPTANSI